ncbi:winged helix-turn-helix transcriptional regulator [Rhodococcus sp. NPDC059968]|uniref:winged helix-turn-helix transcriptional regulator n=1 Tax=Rhodococcus sp. NPDC059968 TaxID=3347017 RepID=UPI00367323C0
MKRPQLAQSACPIDRSLYEIGDSWTFMILRDAMHGVKRFTDFRRHIGIASNVLSVRLQNLVDKGIFEVQESALGNSHEYVLTEKGRDFHAVLSALRQWGQKYLFDDGDEMTRVVERATGKPPAEMVLTSQGGQPLTLEDITVVPITVNRHAET